MDLITELCSNLLAGRKTTKACMEDRGASLSQIKTFMLLSEARCRGLKLVLLLQPPSPEVPRSAVALSETDTVVAWPSLGDAKGPQKKKQSLSAPVTPSKKVSLDFPPAHQCMCSEALIMPRPKVHCDAALARCMLWQLCLYFPT